MKKFLLILLISILMIGCEKMLLGPGFENTPADNFDVLWKTIDEKYGLFPVCPLNWDSLHTVYQSQINESTSENELWEICCQLLSHLNNGHVELANKSYNKGYCAETPPYERSTVSTDLIKSKYLTNSAVTGDGNIIYGQIKNSSLGYICIHSFFGAANGRDWIKDMDDVIKRLFYCNGIIIDVRNNGGGYIRNNLYAASFFIDEEIIYYYSRQKTGPGHYDFGDLIPKKVTPRDDTLKYLKKNVVLTNRYSASGAEAFTLILNNLSYSTQIGDTTIGALGEVSHVVQLPNGWTLYYPCTLTTLADGSSPENIGIIPTILINNSIEDVKAGRDRVIECAIDFLSK
jgi:hypothetical protein